MSMILMMMILWLLPIGAVGFFGWLGLRFVRARERDVIGTGSDQLEQRRLEELVEGLQAEVQALSERQDFMEKLLERPRPIADTTATRHDDGDGDGR